VPFYVQKIFRNDILSKFIDGRNINTPDFFSVIYLVRILTIISATIDKTEIFPTNERQNSFLGVKNTHKELTISRQTKRE